MSEAAEQWDAPGSEPEPPSADRGETVSGPHEDGRAAIGSVFRTYWAALGPLRKQAVLAVVVAAVAGLLEVFALATLIPLLEGPSGKARQDLSKLLHVNPTSTTLLWVTMALFGVLGVAAAVAGFRSDVMGTRIRAKVEETMRRDMATALSATSWPSYIGLRLGDISSSIMLEGNQASIGALGLIKGCGALSIALLFFIAAWILSWQTTIFTIVLGVVLVVAYRWTGRRAASYGKDLAAKGSQIGNQVSDFMGNLKFFKSTGGRDAALGDLTGMLGDFSRMDSRSSYYRGLTKFIFEAGGIVFVVGVLAFSLGTAGRLTASALVFLALFYRLQPRVLIAQDQFLQAWTYRAWYEQWADRMLLVRPNQEVWHGTLAPTFSETLAVQDVAYAYPSSRAPVLKDLTWSLSRGECIAFVGESGSGKTTMLDLLSGLLVPTDGQVLVDGRPLSEIDVDQWQSKIGLVLQESPIFHTSVLKNIAWGTDDPDRAKAMASAEQAYAREFIEYLPHGLDTVVGERGGRLSGGQRQRIALARAIYRDPWLLLLDEATSALDGASEAEIQLALEKLKGRCSIVIVAHRLVTVRMADRIYVLDAGVIVEEGSWAELIARQGAFTAMAARQGLLEAS